MIFGILTNMNNYYTIRKLRKCIKSKDKKKDLTVSDCLLLTSSTALHIHLLDTIELVSIERKMNLELKNIHNDKKTLTSTVINSDLDVIKSLIAVPKYPNNGQDDNNKNKEKVIKSTYIDLKINSDSVTNL